MTIHHKFVSPRSGGKKYLVDFYQIKLVADEINCGHHVIVVTKWSSSRVPDKVVLVT
jgi:hypothetical protein